MMLGEISPHHEYYDSKSSTETPPSYNQLNYNENIERFFKSKPPVATMYGSDEENLNFSNDEGGKTSPTSAARKCMSPINGSGASGSGSAENLSSGSNNLANSTSQGNTSNTASNTTTTTEGFKQPTLTESLLNRHNEDMEKMMMQKHRELRSSIKNSDKLKDSRIKTLTEKMSVDQNNHYINQNHGVKRSGSHSWEGDSFKVSKHDEVSRTSTAGPLPTNVATTVASMSCDQASTAFHANAKINLWPPLSVTVPSVTPVPSCTSPPNANCQAIPRIPMIPQMIPVYYVPVPQPMDTTASTKYLQPSMNLPPPSSMTMPQQSPYMFVPVSYVAAPMPGVMYPPMMGASAPRTMMYRPFLIPDQAPVPQENAKSANKGTDRKRPASQATSIKAEPGSIMAMSESSKKVLSPGELFSSCISNDGGCSSVVDLSTLVNNRQHRNIDYNGDESSSSSFYSSLLCKSSESSCNPDQKTAEQTSEETAKAKHAIRRRDPPWLEGVQLTPELIYEYQLHPKTLNEVLEADMDTLKKLNQPVLVNEQLGQLYFDLELEGFGTKLMLEDGITSSESDSGSSNGSWNGHTSQHKQRRRMVKYGRLMMIHEENAPLPPPLPSQTVSCQET